MILAVSTNRGSGTRRRLGQPVCLEAVMPQRWGLIILLEAILKVMNSGSYLKDETLVPEELTK